MALFSLTLLSGHQLDRLLGRWGYALVLVIVALQSLAVPLPGTTALITASLYAASTHRLQIAGVILAAAVGALAGSVAAFALGRWGGAALLVRHGHLLRLTPARLQVGGYLFDQHGGKIVFFGRFISGLRNVVAFLAGANRMGRTRFLGFCTAAAISWATANGLGYYLFGRALTSAGTPVNIVLVAVLIATWAISGRMLHRSAARFRLASERAAHEARGTAPGQRTARDAEGAEPTTGEPA